MNTQQLADFRANVIAGVLNKSVEIFLHETNEKLPFIPTFDSVYHKSPKGSVLFKRVIFDNGEKATYAMRYAESQQGRLRLEFHSPNSDSFLNWTEVDNGGVGTPYIQVQRINRSGRENTPGYTEH